MVLVLIRVQPEPPPRADPPPMVVALVAPPPPPPAVVEPPDPPDDVAPAPTPKLKPTPPKSPPPPRIKARPARAPAPPDVIPIPVGEGARARDASEVSDGELAGAGTAETGGGGGRGCNMTRRLQSALRKDRMVQAAVAQAHRGQPIRVWNGSWVRHGAQEGAGLAAVREAILWEVGFSPEACRTEPQRGLIVISLNDAPGAPRLVVGSGQWRWSDLLSVTRGARAR